MRGGRAAVLLLAMLAALPALAARPGSEPRPAAANDLVVEAQSGVVVSADRIASQVGVAVLEAGGNAVDAAVAVGFALAVVHPQAGNLGGGGFMLLRLADGTSLALDFRERAPRAAHRDMYLDGRKRVIDGASLHGALAAGVPGSPAGLLHAHARFGSRPLGELIEPAVRLAEEGFVLEHFLADSLAAARRRMSAFASSAAVFYPDGRAPRKGERLVQRDLAATLRRISEHGREGFYGGETARLLVAQCERDGGLISLRDLAEYQPVERQVLRGSYRGYQVLSMPPPSSGGVGLLQMLNLLEAYDLAAAGFGSARCLHWMVEAMRRAYADRARHLADPDFWPVPTAGLIDKAYAARLRETIAADKATPSVAAGEPAGVRKESRETTHFSVVDDAGNAVACTTTLNSSFGNLLVVDGAGFLLNNEMDDFVIKPGVPNQFGLMGWEANAIEPGKRMLSSMTPTIVTRPRPGGGDELFLVLGSPGGGRIINTVLQVLIDVIDHGMELPQAVAAPRIHHQWMPDLIFREPFAVAPETRGVLESMGHRVAPGTTSIGRCQAILVREDGLRIGAADPRSGGAALGY